MKSSVIDVRLGDGRAFERRQHLIFETPWFTLSISPDNSNEYGIVTVPLVSCCCEANLVLSRSTGERNCAKCSKNWGKFPCTEFHFDTELRGNGKQFVAMNHRSWDRLLTAKGGAFNDDLYSSVLIKMVEDLLTETYRLTVPSLTGTAQAWALLASSYSGFDLLHDAPLPAISEDQEFNPS